jgi:DNA-binding LytR/AlgR family response regulator
MVIDEYYSGEELLKAMVLYDMIILDYQMDGINGMEAARTLRDRNINCSIIFLTNYPNFVYEAFEVNAFRFFLIPIDPLKLQAALDDYFKMYGNDYPILLQYERATVPVDTKEIVYLEAMNKNCRIHLVKSHMDCAKTMAVINRSLPRSHFYKVNRAFIINFNYIARYNNDEIFFKNSEKVHVSRNYLTAFKTAYREYSDLTNPKRQESK